MLTDDETETILDLLYDATRVFQLDPNAGYGMVGTAINFIEARKAKHKVASAAKEPPLPLPGELYFDTINAPYLEPTLYVVKRIETRIVLEEEKRGTCRYVEAKDLNETFRWKKAYKKETTPAPAVEEPPPRIFPVVTHVIKHVP